MLSIFKYAVEIQHLRLENSHLLEQYQIVDSQTKMLHDKVERLVSEAREEATSEARNVKIAVLDNYLTPPQKQTQINFIAGVYPI